MKPAIVIDLNETLLDMSALDATFGRIFEAATAHDVRRRWFEQVVEMFLTTAVIHQYRSFDEIIVEALHVVAGQLGTSASSEDATTLARALGEIPPYADVRPGLERLKHAGFSVAVLTNSTLKAARKPIDHAQLGDLLASVLSVDDIERYKPEPEAYAYAARQIAVGLDDLVLVAAHPWDLAGALAAGCRAAFVERPGKVLPRHIRPQLRARDLDQLAMLLVQEYAQ